MLSLLAEVRAAADAARAILRRKPRVAIILGTGLGGLAREIRDARRLPYAEIPGFPSSTVESHAGQLVAGTLEGLPVLAMEGRFHYYEGYTLRSITLPVRVARELGAEILVVSGATGGMNPQYARGDVVLLEDQINLLGANPLIGPNEEELGPRFPDMSRPYDRALLELAEREALRLGVRTHRGVYVGVAGPNLETRAEYRFLRQIGADVVGMSVVPEVIVAVHAGLRVLGLAVVTDLCLPDALAPAKIEEIIAAANAAEPRMTQIVRRVLAALRRGAARGRKKRGGK
jgi:purine-nucleoside phosphorylase